MNVLVDKDLYGKYYQTMNNISQINLQISVHMYFYLVCSSFNNGENEVKCECDEIAISLVTING